MATVFSGEHVMNAVMVGGWVWLCWRHCKAYFGNETKVKGCDARIRVLEAENSDLSRTVALYAEAHPLKCLNCSAEFAGPLPAPVGGVASGCPKCSNLVLVVPTDDPEALRVATAQAEQDRAQAEQEKALDAAREAHRKSVAEAEKNGLSRGQRMLRDSLTANLMNVDYLFRASHPEINEDMRNLYGLWKVSKDERILAAFVGMQASHNVMFRFNDSNRSTLRGILQKIAEVG